MEPNETTAKDEWASYIPFPVGPMFFTPVNGLRGEDEGMVSMGYSPIRFPINSVNTFKKMQYFILCSEGGGGGEER
jgi:hypothetical protein